jgi:hypothetical protein
MILTTKFCLLAGALLLLAPVAVAEPVRMPFKAEPGTSWKIQRKQTTTATYDGRTTEESGVLAATLKVIEADDAGFLMEWTTDSASGEITAIDGMASDLFIGASVRFRTDRSGAPIALANVQTVLDSVTIGMQRKGLDKNPALVDATMKGILEFAPAVQAGYFLTDAAQIAACQGLTLEKGKPVKRTTASPKFGNSPTVDLHITTTLQDAGSAKAPARIQTVEAADMEAIKKAMAEAAKLRAKPGDPPVDIDAAVANLSRTTTRNCSVDRQTGGAQAVTVEVVLSIDTRQVRVVHAITIARAP